MKRLITSALAATLLVGAALAGSPAAAQQRHDANPYAQNQDRRDDNRGPDRRDERRDERRDDRRDERQHDSRAYGHDRREAAHERQAERRWARGQRLDARYRDNRYYVRDYHRHGLRAPPRGYRWQRVDNDYVLAAVATGLIMSVIQGR